MWSTYESALVYEKCIMNKVILVALFEKKSSYRSTLRPATVRLQTLSGEEDIPLAQTVTPCEGRLAYANS